LRSHDYYIYSCELVGLMGLPENEGQKNHILFTACHSGKFEIVQALRGGRWDKMVDDGWNEMRWDIYDLISFHVM